MGRLTEEDTESMYSRAEYIATEYMVLKDDVGDELITEEDVLTLPMDDTDTLSFWMDNKACMLQYKYDRNHQESISMLMLVDKEVRLDAISIVALGELLNIENDDMDFEWLSDNHKLFNVSFRDPIEGERATLVVDVVYNKPATELDEEELINAYIALQTILFIVDEMLTKSAEENLVALQKLQGEPDGSA